MKAKEQLKQLEETTASQMWQKELEEFESSWISMKKDRLALLNSDGKVKVKKSKK